MNEAEAAERHRLIELPIIRDRRGNLTFVEGAVHAPFDIRRVYYLYDVPGGESRAGHAHREVRQLLIAVAGSFDVILDDGRTREVVTLNRSYIGLYIPRLVWREIREFLVGLRLPRPGVRAFRRSRLHPGLRPVSRSVDRAQVTVPFLDLRAAIEEIRPELDEAWSRVRDSGRYILGDEVAAFESDFADYCGTRHCVGVANGLDALKLLLTALGIGTGDEVIVPAYTAVATWMAVTAMGGRPVGVDVERDSFNIDPRLVEAALTPRTKAIVAVHLFGRPADIDRLAEIAARHGLVLLEDAAQAHGARVGGRRVGSLARAAAFSFYPTKNLGAVGDGGAITTDDDDLADRVRLLRAYGWRERSVSEIFGLNSRLDELQAAFLRVRLRRLDDQNRRRRRLAGLYAEALVGLPDLVVPSDPVGADPVWHVYAVRITDRPAAQSLLGTAGIGTLVHYEPLPHLTPAYRATGWGPGDLPVAESLAASELSLPMFPQLQEEAVLEVVAALRG